MNGRPRSFLLLVVSCVAGAVAITSSGCEQANEPPPETPKSAANRPPDVTEVTMEVSSAVPPGESSPNAAGSTSAASAVDAGPPAVSAGADPAGEPIIGGPQSDPAVEKAVAPVRPRLRACYKKALAAEPNVGGSATFDATIGKDGKVASARFVKRDGLNEDMVGCLLAAVKSMTFDAGKKSQIVTLSFGSSPSSPSGSSSSSSSAGSPSSPSSPSSPTSAAGGGDAGAKR